MPDTTFQEGLSIILSMAAAVVFYWATQAEIKEKEE